MTTATAEQTTTAPTPTLTAEPCDGKECGARSWYFATVNGTILSYCGHHATKYEVGLLAKATKIVDLRYLITP